MPEQPQPAQGYIYNGEIYTNPIPKLDIHYPNARRFKAYPFESQTLYDRSLTRALCKELGALNKDGTPNDPLLKQLIHIVCNYRYRAFIRKPDNPSVCIFHYSANKNYLVTAISGMTETFLDVLSFLNNAGLVVDDRQDSIDGKNSGKESTFCFTLDFEALVGRLEESKEIQKTEKPDENYRGVEFQDDNFIIIKENLPERSKEENESAIKHFVDLDNAPTGGKIKRINTPLKKYNKLLKESAYSLMPLNQIEEENLLTNDLKEKYKKFDSFDFEDKLRVNRQYADFNLNTYGRLHGGFWQNMPSDLRSFIYINNYQTVELDYSSMQPNILFSLVGAKPLYDDVYRVHPYDETIEEFREDLPRFNRQLIKDCFMLLINSKDPKNRFISNILARLRKEMEYAIEYWMDEDDNIKLEELYNRHAEWQSPEFRQSLFISLQKSWEPIWDILGTDYNWRQLTKLDSDIAFKVIKNLTNLGIPVLSVHDSFIVQGNKVDILYDAMCGAYKEVVEPLNGLVPRITYTHLSEERIIYRNKEEVITIE